MKRNIVILIVLVVLIALMLLSTINTSNNVIKIGLVGPLSGDMAFIGEGAQNAFTLVEKELSNTKYTYEFVYEDDQFDLKTASLVTEKLVNINNVDAIISIFSGTGRVVSGISKENDVLHIAIASDPEISKGELNFVHWTPVEKESKVYVDQLLEDNIQNITFFVSNSAGTKLYYDYVREHIESTNITIINEFFINPKEKNFRTILEKGKNDNSKMFAFFVMSPEIEVLTKQLKELGITKPISSIGGIFETSQEIELFEGQWYINTAEPNQVYLNKYKEEFGVVAPIGSAHVYDALSLIIESYENTKNDNYLASGYLKGINDYLGALGRLDVLESGIIDSDAIVKVIRDNVAVVLN